MPETVGHRMAHDWFDAVVPPNVRLAEGAFLESAYSLAMFRSQRDPGLVFGRASAAYHQAAFIVGPRGRVDVGDFACLNSTTIICQDRVVIGRHCLTAWGAVITDSWVGPDAPVEQRRAAALASSRHPHRPFPVASAAQPVTLQDNVWVGFGAVIMPGVTLGRGCVIGCRTVVNEDVAPYTVVAGDPPRVVRTLEPTDTDTARAEALRTFITE